MGRTNASILGLAAAAGWLAACTAEVPAPVPENTATLQAWASPLPSSTSAAMPEILEPIATPGPSPTPLVHAVQAGETLLEIALEYGVELNDLLVANPGVNPRFLSIGQQLMIPGPEGEPAAALLPSPTPLAITLSAVNCFRTLEGMLRCFTSASHEFEGAVEGLVALITLVSPAGEAVRTEPAYAPLNLLDFNGIMPMVASFASPVPDFAGARAEILSAVSASAVGERYADLELEVEEVKRSENGRMWTVQGRLALVEPATEEPLQANVLLVALASDGSVIGFRVGQLDLLNEAQFVLSVSSLGPQIADIEAYAEAPFAP